jgi:hypothetical protein
VSATVGFSAFLVLTVLLLAGVVATGLKARRRLHIPLVALTLVSLVLTIVFAERLGREYDLASAGVIKPIHLTLAKVTTLAYLLPLATGVRTIFRPTARAWHRRFAFLVLGMTVLTLVTGALMITLAEPLPARALETGALDARPRHAAAGAAPDVQNAWPTDMERITSPSAPAATSMR